MTGTMVSSISTHTQRQLARWSEAHAIAMLAAAALVLGGASLWLMMAAALLSFAALVWRCREAWQRAGRFGAANMLTSTRIVATLGLPALAAATAPLAVGACALAVFALDGVDGWLARRQGLDSEFGEYLDKEADAFLLLVLCVLLYAGGRLGAWIIVPGLLRYAFVVFLLLARPPVLKERRSILGRWIYFGMIAALIAAFTPFPAFYEPYAALMSIALTYSFADTLFEIYRRPQATQA
jgi:phosphatidylglycerophosphate synthase